MLDGCMSALLELGGDFPINRSASLPFGFTKSPKPPRRMRRVRGVVVEAASSCEIVVGWRIVGFLGRLIGMELSVFLAKLFGIYLLIVGVLWAVRGEVISEVVEEFFASRPMLLLSGLLALAIGIAMVISHSIWELNWRGLITLIGYLSIAKGIARVGFPEVSHRVAGSLLKGSRSWIWITIVLVLGGYLTWVGFTSG